MYTASVAISVPAYDLATPSTSESSISVVTSSEGLPATAPLNVDLGVVLVEPLALLIVLYVASDIVLGVVAPALRRGGPCRVDDPLVDNLPLVDDLSDSEFETEMESGANSIQPQNFKGTTTENADIWLPLPVSQFKRY